MALGVWLAARFKKGGQVGNSSGCYFYWCMACDKDVEHCNNQLLKHLVSQQKCPTLSASNQAQAQVLLSQCRGANKDKPLPNTPILTDAQAKGQPLKGGGDVATQVTGPPQKCPRLMQAEVTVFVDWPLSAEEEASMHLSILWYVITSNTCIQYSSFITHSFFVHSHIPFNAANNPFFQEIFHRICPSYSPPSRFILGKELLASEHAEVTAQEMQYLEAHKMFTFILDGWDDLHRQSQYVALAQKCQEPGVLLHMEEMTGKHVDGKELCNFADQSLANMNMIPKQLIAVCTNNPCIMQKFCRLWANQFKWIITIPCFLHQINTLVGNIPDHPIAKKVISSNARIVLFFNQLHYWGSELKKSAHAKNVTHWLVMLPPHLPGGICHSGMAGGSGSTKILLP